MFPSRQRWEKKNGGAGGRGPGGERDPGEGWSSVAQLDKVFSYVCLQMNQTRQVNEYIN